MTSEEQARDWLETIEVDDPADIESLAGALDEIRRLREGWAEAGFSLEHAPFSAYHTEVVRRLFGDGAADAPHKAVAVARESAEREAQEERERVKRIVSDVRECDLYQIRDVRASRFACDEILRRLEAEE